MAPAAFALAIPLSIDLPRLMRPDAPAIFIGLLATAPPALLLHWFMRTSLRAIAEFRRSQVEFFAKIGFRLTPLRGALLALAAGVGEEALFRGVLQTSLDAHMPTMAAIFGTSLVFGALHARTFLYAAAAGLISLYLGALFSLTGGLTAPMIVHGLYDFFAFEATRRAIDQRTLADSKGSSSTG